MPLRIRAFIYHGLLSAVIILLVCTVALLRWFPYPLYLLDGTLGALLMLALVDIVIGPAITLLVFTANKSIKERAIDCSVIACVQVAALGYGLSQIHDQEIVALVHVDNAFHPVPRKELYQEIKDEWLPTYKSIRFGMLIEQDFKGLLGDELKKKMYDPDQYRRLTREQVMAVEVPLENVPDSLKARHGEGAIFKFVFGKKSNGIAVLDESMQIIDLDLALE